MKYRIGISSYIPCFQYVLIARQRLCESSQLIKMNIACGFTEALKSDYYHDLNISLFKTIITIIFSLVNSRISIIFT